MIRDPKKFKEFKMPWGKYRGKAIHTIPSSYLHWLAENCPVDLVSTLADDEWQYREKHNQHIGD